MHIRTFDTTPRIYTTTNFSSKYLIACTIVYTHKEHSGDDVDDEGAHISGCGGEMCISITCYLKLVDYLFTRT